MISAFSLNYDYIMIKYEYGSSTKRYDYLINKYGSRAAKYDTITL